MGFFSAILLEDSLNKLILVEIARMLNVSEENTSLMYLLGILNYKKSMKGKEQLGALHV